MTASAPVDGAHPAARPRPAAAGVRPPRRRRRRPGDHRRRRAGAGGAGDGARPASRSRCPTATRRSCTRAPAWPHARRAASSTRRARSTPATAARSRCSLVNHDPREHRAAVAAATASPSWSSSGSSTRSSTRSTRCPARPAARAATAPPAASPTRAHDDGARTSSTGKAHVSRFQRGATTRTPTSARHRRRATTATTSPATADDDDGDAGACRAGQPATLGPVGRRRGRRSGRRPAGSTWAACGSPGRGARGARRGRPGVAATSLAVTARARRRRAAAAALRRAAHEGIWDEVRGEIRSRHHPARRHVRRGRGTARHRAADQVPVRGPGRQPACSRPASSASTGRAGSCAASSPAARPREPGPPPRCSSCSATSSWSVAPARWRRASRSR